MGDMLVKVVWNMFNFPFHIWVVILPIDELHHFSRWVGQPATRYGFSTNHCYGLNPFPSVGKLSAGNTIPIFTTDVDVTNGDARAPAM